MSEKVAISLSPAALPTSHHHNHFLQSILCTLWDPYVIVNTPLTSMLSNISPHMLINHHTTILLIQTHRTTQQILSTGGTNAIATCLTSQEGTGDMVEKAKYICYTKITFPKQS